MNYLILADENETIKIPLKLLRDLVWYLHLKSHSYKKPNTVTNILKEADELFNKKSDKLILRRHALIELKKRMCTIYGNLPGLYLL